MLLTIPATVILMAGCSKHDASRTAVPMILRTEGHQWTSSEAAATNSVEGKLRAAGKSWVKSGDEIVKGSYVQDTLEGRLDQPVGRGAIGMVTAVTQEPNGGKVAMVDFGCGYSVGLSFSELSAVKVVPN